MIDTSNDQAVAEIAASLTRRATELWGPDRVSALQDVIEQMALAIRQMESDPPPANEEPAFYL